MGYLLYNKFFYQLFCSQDKKINFSIQQDLTEYQDFLKNVEALELKTIFKKVIFRADISNQSHALSYTDTTSNRPQEIPSF